VLRTITKVEELFDVSPVTYPAYRATEVTVRAWTGIARAELEAWRSGTNNPDAWRAALETLRRRHRQVLSR
jgi:phage head maturation protease